MKIKNENDYLGLLIKNMNKDNYVPHKKISAYIDDGNIIAFNKVFESKGWVYTTDLDGVYLTIVGINNYISTKDRIFSWLISLLKFIVSYTAGVVCGILATWLMIKIGIS